MNYRWYRHIGFFSRFVENVKHDIAKNKEMKKSLKKFREETMRLEQSEVLQKARQKFEAVEMEASKGKDIIKDKLDTIRDKVNEVMEEAGKTGIGKKAESITKGAAAVLSEQKEKLEKCDTYKTITRTASAVKDELEPSAMVGGIYEKPAKLRRRTESLDERKIKPNTEKLGLELHKDSKLHQSWQKFRDNHPYINKLLNLKTKYEESDNPIIEVTRSFAEKLGGAVGGIFGNTELSEALTEICKIDPSFDKTQFLKDCESDIIPNILEALIQGELDILRDWCYDCAYSYLEIPIRKAKNCGHKFSSKILHIDNVDIVFGKIIEKGPVLVLNFTTQQIFCIRNREGVVVEGNPEKILRVVYVWALCRDRSEYNPKSAWRLLDLSAHSDEQLF